MDNVGLSALCGFMQLPLGGVSSIRGQPWFFTLVHRLHRTLSFGCFTESNLFTSMKKRRSQNTRSSTEENMVVMVSPG